MTGTAHVDTFVRDRLPPRELWPETDWSGAPELAYPDSLNAAAWLLDAWIARGHGERTALHHAGGAWTYQRVFETANQVARVLVEDCGLVPGGRVLLRAANHPWLVACWFGALKAGGVAVTTSPLLRVRELSDIVQQANVGLAITDAAIAADLQSALADRDGARIVLMPNLVKLAAAKPADFETVATAADDPAIIAFTSGTTGRSKGTVHAHRDLLAASDTYGRYVLRLSADDICIGSPPLAFTYGLGGLVLFPFRSGASTALIEHVSPPHLLEGIAAFRATVTVTSPTAYRAMLDLLGADDISSLRACVSAGETLPAATFDAWQRATGLRLMDGIGSTEMLHIFIGSPAGECKAGSTGKVVRGYSAKVVDAQGVEVPRGTVGRLVVKGPTGCRYLDNLEHQRKYVERGWNVTGDAYRQDADGYFWYEARMDDMIISSGYNISGVEIENVLLSHGSVAECAVIGVPDEARGQIVKAVIVPASGVAPTDALARELQNFVKKEIAPYKYPRAIQFVTALPRTLTGKLQRFRLRDGLNAADGGPNGGVQAHEPAGWPSPKGYANAVSATGRMVFVSGQVGWDPITLKFAAADFPAEVRQALLNVVTALAAAGARPDQITRLTWYITDRHEYLRLRREIGVVYREVVGRHFPAMSMVVVNGLIEADARVEIEATAVI